MSTDKKMQDLSFTEAAARSGVVVTMLGLDNSHSNARHVPYAELYQGQSGLIETPIEHLQRAAEDERRRQS